MYISTRINMCVYIYFFFYSMYTYANKYVYIYIYIYVYTSFFAVCVAYSFAIDSTNTQSKTPKSALFDSQTLALNGDFRIHLIVGALVQYGSKKCG